MKKWVGGVSALLFTSVLALDAQQVKADEITSEEPRITAVETEPVAQTDIVAPIAEARESEEPVTVSGQVTAHLKNTTQIQDDSAAIAVYPGLASRAEIGDQVTVSGTPTDFNGLLELSNPEVQTIESGAQPIEPEVVTGAEIDEAHESQLVTVNQVKINETQGNGNYPAEADGARFIVRDEFDNLGIEAGQTYDQITGIVSQYNKDYQLIPRNVSDVVLDEKQLPQPVASPEATTFPIGTAVSLSVANDDADIYYTIDGSKPSAESTRYTGPITINEDVTLQAIVIADGFEDSDILRRDFHVFDDTNGIPIHEIQGDGHWSPMQKAFVENVRGVVTYKYDLRGSRYYHIQTPDEYTDEDPNTSEAILIYAGKSKEAPEFEIGDLIAVSGTVDEFYVDGYDDRATTDLPVTQINARADKGGSIQKLAANQDLPQPVIIDKDSVPTEIISPEGFEVFDPENYAIDYWESLEGMRVRVANLQAIAPQAYGDLFTMPQERLAEKDNVTVNGGVRLTEDNFNPEKIVLDPFPDNEARKWNVLTGDQFNGTFDGVVSYGFGNYRIMTDLEPLQASQVSAGTTPETPEIIPAEDKLTIASFNLENFSANTKETTNKKTEQLAHIIAESLHMPDIIGVTEMQDNNGSEPGATAADESYQRLITAIEEASGVMYQYVNIDPENNKDGGQPDANIRVGFLYNPERVSLIDGISGDATTAIDYQDGALTLNPGRINPTSEAFSSSRKPLVAAFEFQDQPIILIVNHWNSKGGDDGEFGQHQPVQKSSEIQRGAIAEEVANFVDQVQADNPEANIVLVGDFNDFEFSDALKAVTNNGERLVDMVNRVPEAERYSYIYNGNSQVLDHALVSPNLADQSILHMVKVNSDFTEEAGRSSDHDPLLLEIDFSEEPEEEKDDVLSSEQKPTLTLPEDGEKQEEDNDPSASEEKQETVADKAPAKVFQDTQSTEAHEDESGENISDTQSDENEKIEQKLPALTMHHTKNEELNDAHQKTKQLPEPTPPTESRIENSERARTSRQVSASNEAKAANSLLLSEDSKRSESTPSIKGLAILPGEVAKAATNVDPASQGPTEITPATAALPQTGVETVALLPLAVLIGAGSALVLKKPKH